MSYRSAPLALGTSDTDIYTVPATLSAVVVLGIHNVNGSARTVTLKYYKQSTAETLTFVSGLSVAANSSIKLAAPFSMEQGDKLIGLASNSASVHVTPFITDSAAAPAAIGFTPRGVYDPDATYAVNDYVRLNGNVYYSIQDGNTGNDPETETAWWMAGPEKGDPGDLTAADIGVTVQPYDPTVFSPETRTMRDVTGATDTLVIGDAGNIVVGARSSGNLAITVPPDGDVAFENGTQIDIVRDQAGELELVAGSGVTINSEDSKKKLNKQNSPAVLLKRGTNTWMLFGSLKA